MRTLNLAITIALTFTAANPNARAQTVDYRPVTPLSFGVIECGIDQTEVIRHESTEQVERAFILIEIPAIGDSLVIDLAEFVFTASTICDSTQPLLITLSPATEPVSSRGSSWREDWTDMSGGFDPEYLATLPVSSTEADKEIRIDVTEIVRRWVSGEITNHGFVLKSISEDKSTFTWTRDGRYKGDDAKLEIYYSRNPLSAQ